MIDFIRETAEEFYGIKTDPDDVKKFLEYLREAYSIVDGEIIKKAFFSGEAARFLTVNETYFFREPAHFELIKGLLPLYQTKGIRICSAAAASGCEAYSIAMLIEAYNKGLEKPLPYHIDAFDINPKMIELAEQGIYTEHSLREDGSSFRYLADSFLKKMPDQSGELKKFIVDPGLKKNINFFVYNLNNLLPSKAYDIIFFRNVFIYLTLKSRERALSNLAAVLKDGGILLLGISETAGARHPGLEQINQNGVFYFRKK